MFSFKQTASVLVRRYVRARVHPQLFMQTVQLTDGSLTRMPSLSPSRPFLKLSIDAQSHPAWNAGLCSRMLMEDNGEVKKFKDRFAELSVSEDEMADVFGGMVAMRAHQERVTKKKEEKKGAVSKGKKK